MPFAEVADVKLYYTVYGEGEPVVFIHGIGVTSKVWEFQKDYISSRNRMIVYDLRGSGKSSRTPSVFHTVELLSHDLKGLLDYLKLERVGIVGLSAGAAIAMKFAIQYPQYVNRMVLSGAFADLSGIQCFFAKCLPPGIGKVLMSRIFGQMAVRLMLPSASAEKVSRYQRDIICIDSEEIRKCRQLLNSYTIMEALPQIKAPTLLLYGQYDRLAHKQGIIISQLIPNCRARIIMGTGHGANGERSELFNKIVTDFINSRIT